MNSEQLLKEVATAIKHRCISTTHRWHVICYAQRICCVPTYENVPPEIILTEFTENMAQEGFSIHQWNQLKTKLIKLYKELHK